MKRFREYMIITYPLRPKQNKATFMIDNALYLANGSVTT
jgi:hypothetical protein